MEGLDRKDAIPADTNFNYGRKERVIEAPNGN